MSGQDRGQIAGSITTADVVEPKFGRLELTDEYPTAEAATRLRDEMNDVHGVQAFMNSIQQWEGPIQGLESLDGPGEREGFRGSGIRSFGAGGLELRHRGWLR